MMMMMMMITARSYHTTTKQCTTMNCFNFDRLLKNRTCVTFTVVSKQFTIESHRIMRGVVINIRHIVLSPVPVAAQSKAQVCGRSPAEIVGSNPAEGMDVCLLWVLCVVRKRSLRLAYHSSRGVLPTVVRRCV